MLCDLSDGRERSEALEAENVTDYSQMLQDIMGESVKVGCLHRKK